MLPGMLPRLAGTDFAAKNKAFRDTSLPAKTTSLPGQGSSPEILPSLLPLGGREGGKYLSGLAGFRLRNASLVWQGSIFLEGNASLPGQGSIGGALLALLPPEAAH